MGWGGAKGVASRSAKRRCEEQEPRRAWSPPFGDGNRRVVGEGEVAVGDRQLGGRDAAQCRPSGRISGLVAGGLAEQDILSLREVVADDHDEWAVVVVEHRVVGDGQPVRQ